MGIVLGRWVNLSIDRLPPLHAEGEASSGPTSRPPLSFLDLAPLVSFAALLKPSPNTRRWLRCRPPLVEVITALLCGVVAYRYVLNLGAALLVHVAFVDLEHTLILNKVVFPPWRWPWSLSLSHLWPKTGAWWKPTCGLWAAPAWALRSCSWCTECPEAG
ncbi:MAG: hypothetical protein EXR46_03320 [Dehalococcoidia bacterium]|nr:hypothetical protein [Dehalococcoidia bacterium]